MNEYMYWVGITVAALAAIVAAAGFARLNPTQAMWGGVIVVMGLMLAAYADEKR